MRLERFTLRGQETVQTAIEENDARVQIVARTDFNLFSGDLCVADENDVMRKSSDLRRAPRNTFDDARIFSDGNHVADIKRLIGVQRNSGEQIAERILQGETENNAEQGGCRQQRAE